MCEEVGGSAGSIHPDHLVAPRADPDQVLSAVEQTSGVERATIADRADGIAVIETVLDGAPGSPQARSAVEDLRAALVPYDDTHVTGTEAESVDEAAGASRDRKLILPLILALVLGALLLLLRAVVAPPRP